MKNIIANIIKKFSDKINYNNKNLFIILAAGHGKRIKSNTSKMMHKIWGETTVNRVVNSCRSGLNTNNSIIVTGIKADEVIKSIGHNKNMVFAYQKSQNGTGDAVISALKSLNKSYVGWIYIFCGDMGLLDYKSVKLFYNYNKKKNGKMSVMTGLFRGSDSNKNHYGRIIRIPEFDQNNQTSGSDFGKVVDIVEYKDILRLKNNKEIYKFSFNGRDYALNFGDLLNIKEYNSGVYAINSQLLFKNIKKISNKNASNEYYLTDIVKILSSQNFNIFSFTPENQNALLGFNTKSELKILNNIYKKNIYELLGDIIEFEDENDFYIDDSVVKYILKLEKKYGNLDIFIGKGSFLGKSVVFNKSFSLGRNSKVTGNIKFGENITIGSNCSIKTSGKIIIKDNFQCFGNVRLQGDVSVGNNNTFNGNIIIRGDRGCLFADNVSIFGNSYVSESKIVDNVEIFNSILENLVIKKSNSKKVKIKNYFPSSKSTVFIGKN